MRTLWAAAAILLLISPRLEAQSRIGPTYAFYWAESSQGVCYVSNVVALFEWEKPGNDPTGSKGRSRVEDGWTHYTDIGLQLRDEVRSLMLPMLSARYGFEERTSGIARNGKLVPVDYLYQDSYPVPPSEPGAEAYVEDKRMFKLRQCREAGLRVQPFTVTTTKFYAQ